jgi:hypothetical protein
MRARSRLILASPRREAPHPQDPHQLVVTYWQGRMEAGCPCGRWEQEEFLLPGQRPSQLLPTLEWAFARHVAEAGGPEAQRQRELVFVTDWRQGLARERERRERERQRERERSCQREERERDGQREWLPRAAPSRAAPWRTRLLVALQVLAVVLLVSRSAPLKDLLPAAPKVRKSAGPVLVEDLARVPEVEFQAAPDKALPAPDATRDTAHLVAKINHLNGKKPDGFLEALRGARPDLAGLPFVMGDECRTEGERSRQFSLAVATVRRALRSSGATPTLDPGADRAAAETFWREYQTACVREDQRFRRAGQAPSEAVTLARIAALTQVLAPEGPGLRLGLVKYLAAVSHVEATRALARLVLFSPEEEVRRAAVEALKSSRQRDYTEILLSGLRYPWPAVARRAGQALVGLQRTDLVPQLVALLGEPDPRAPVVQEVNHKRVSVVRELVRINHLRSCLLCHAPGEDRTNSAPEALTAPIPVPGTPLPAQGYSSPSPDLVVRFDVTYLRQDFSAYQPVPGARPWPGMQRFDFVTRTRVLTEAEAAAYREELARWACGQPSPYHQAVLAALRGLAGEGWRRLLGLPAPPRRDDPVPHPARTIHVPKGMRAYTVQTPSLAAGVASGRRVDVLLTVGRGEKHPIAFRTFTLLKGVQILAVEKPRPQPGGGLLHWDSLVTLLVSPDQVARLTRADRVGALDVVSPSRGDGEEFPPAEEHLLWPEREGEPPPREGPPRQEVEKPPPPPAPPVRIRILRGARRGGP